MERLPQHSQQPDIDLEHPDVFEFVSKGEYGIRHFRGQIQFFIPNSRLNRLGIVGLMNCLIQVYGAELFSSWASPYQYRQSLSLELPPQREKVEDLMALIDRRIAPDASS